MCEKISEKRTLKAPFSRTLALALVFRARYYISAERLLALTAAFTAKRYYILLFTTPQILW
jgi:hypothetical protein